MASSALGDYLSTRRARVTPAEANLPVTGHRRVPGLRREEVAALAGISADYYVRLEQGRERTPSAQVLEALSVALRLGDDGRAHLFRLAGLAPTAVPRAVIDRVEPSLLRLMDNWPDNAALIYNRAYDVLASNEIADALFQDFGPEHNLMLLVFLSPRARQFYVDWPRVAANSVAGFRLNHAAAPDDPRIRSVLTTLLEQSAEFRDLWARHDARGKAAETKTFEHPDVGTITLSMQTFDVRSSPGQELVVYHAEPGTPSATAMALLGTMAATRRQSPT
ncbi:helix-turn-helix transcriptional regulator [Prauserella rugosa]|uniref:Transcriptional regulator, XRE family n=1 Tax=Prauserella rugosa TaxID=43354 RepID=A0A660CIG4_9PSEU|nr:helix-turn-helix transcriptional regulator [Prauserella rugosa]KMS90664.1 XRE family transcriptional regulator [Streptomyces regensis]TWH20735.1 transcriptional regulator, XRE family [Prauserella rugosa]